MPCTYDNIPDTNEAYKKDLDKLTQLLCETCSLLENKPDFKWSENLKTWWTDHKKSDEEKEKLLRAAKEVERRMLEKNIKEAELKLNNLKKKLDK